VSVASIPRELLIKRDKDKISKWHKEQILTNALWPYLQETFDFFDSLHKWYIWSIF